MDVVEMGEAGAVAVVRLTGELDLAEVKQLREALDEAGKRAGELLVVDLRDTTFLDSTAMGAFVGAKKRLALRGCGLMLVNVRPQPARPLQLTHLWEVLNAHALGEPMPTDVAQALEGRAAS